MRLFRILAVIAVIAAPSFATAFERAPMVLLGDVPAEVLPLPVANPLLQVGAALLDLVMGGVLGLIGLLAMYLRSKSATDKAARIGLVITEAARSVVLELDATIKPKLKEFLSDGVLSDEEKGVLKALALNILKTKLPAGVLQTAANVFGAAFLDTYLGGKIEQAVAEKNSVQAAGAASPQTA